MSAWLTIDGLRFQACGLVTVTSDYAYELTYNTSNQQITSVKKNGSTVYASTNTGKISSEWDFDRKTGIGPFNSFYAAIEKGYQNSDTNKLCDSSQIGHIAYILDPYDLTKALLPNGDKQSYTIQQLSLIHI